jgi:hypothetical protein
MPSDILIPQNSVSQIRHFMLRSSTTGQGLTGKVASDFSGKYNVAGGPEVTLSFSPGSAGDAYSSGKIVPLGLGKYAWHVPDTVFSDSAGSVSAVLSCSGAIDVHFDWTVVAADRTQERFGAPTGGAISQQIANDIEDQENNWDAATQTLNDAVLEAIGEIEGGGGLTGPYTRTATVTDADTDEPIEGAKVRLYRTGETGTVATDEDGIASFTVEAATWSYAVTAGGYTGVSGTVVVSANGNINVQMTAVSITPPSNPSLSAIVVLCLDAAGQPEADVDIDIRIVTVPSGSQNIAYKGAKQTATSDEDGIARFEVVQGSVCEWKRGKADVWSTVTIDSDSVTNVTSVIGSP